MPLKNRDSVFLHKNRQAVLTAQYKRFRFPKLRVSLLEWDLLHMQQSLDPLHVTPREMEQGKLTQT